MEDIAELLQSITLDASVIDQGCRCIFPKVSRSLIKDSRIGTDATQPDIATILQHHLSNPYFDVDEASGVQCRFYLNPADGGFVVHNLSSSSAIVFLSSSLSKDKFEIKISECASLCIDTWTLATRDQPQVFVFRIIDPSQLRASTAMLDANTRHDDNMLQRRTPLIFGKLTPPSLYTLETLYHLGGPDWNTIRKKTGSNSVYVGRHSMFGDIVVKSMWTPTLQAKDLIRKINCWIKETSIHRDLSHDRIVRFEGCDARCLLLFVERVDGPNLAEMRDDQGMWTGSEKVAQAIWMDGLSALEYLRQNSVLHLDIKPGNLVWAVNERIAKLCDFGTASRGNTEKGGGTPYYVPPEFWAGMGRSPASDMYGLGIVMLYVLRYIALPELCCGWDIHEALSSAKSESYREMCNWLDFVEEKRKVIKDPEVSGMIAVIPRDRSEPGELLEYLQPIGLDLSSRFGDSMCVTWEGFLGTRPTDKGSTTIPFTSPMSPTAIPEVASNLVATAVVGKRRRTTRIFKTRARFAEDNTSSTDTSAQLRRSARIARRNNVSELHL